MCIASTDTHSEPQRTATDTHSEPQRTATDTHSEPQRTPSAQCTTGAHRQPQRWLPAQYTTHTIGQPTASRTDPHRARAAALYHDSPDTHPQGRVLIHSKQAYARTQPLQRAHSPTASLSGSTGTMYHRHGATASAALCGYRWHALRLCHERTPSSAYVCA